MNKFEKQLEKWNGGVLRGAQAKLAKILQVSTATVALWSTGKRRPSKGFLAKMAHLFAMDAYDVMRLFPPLTTYPDMQPRRTPDALHDALDGSNAYSVDNFTQKGNSVSVPLLTGVTAAFPLYEESDVAEWWTFPRRAAQGGKWLLATTDNTGPHEKHTLLLFRPAQELENGKIMLVRVLGKTQLTRVKILGEMACLYAVNGTQKARFSLAEIIPLATAVLKITDAF